VPICSRPVESTKKEERYRSMKQMVDFFAHRELTVKITERRAAPAACCLLPVG
jgi:hypothetical protein